MAGTHVQYPLPQRSRLHSALLAIAALLCAMAFVAAVSQLSRNDSAHELTPPPALAPIDLPASSAIGPGAGIFVEYADGSGGMGCTAGFLVRTAAGQTGVLTAGHCNRPGGPAKVTMNLGGVLPYTTVGTFSQTVSEGVHNEQHDIGLVILNGDIVPQSAAIGASLPVSGVATNLQIGQELCKFGMGSGEATCGPITEVTKSKVVFLAPGRCGDSGGPVYLHEGDGTVRAVGILIRGGIPNTPKPGCSAPARFSVAELVRPWLDKWRLTTVTAGASAAG
ncbi:trypsin-like serine protease [Mycobacterium sp. E1747]|uniref:trypsin-like serine protease n=1 Tax=Mycobacterium sp. E1747 TaxID=1834128 RepID=UPI0007FE7AC4|nr:trypsin-like serine protease [Mycobacterium sp. E1747]OBH10734.1 endopeptidase [Mycobacterium sp. E1747]